MPEDIGDGIKINGEWKNNAKKWFWKLAFTPISAKVLITSGAIITATCLTVYKTIQYIVLTNPDGSQSVVEVSQPYINSQNWTDAIIAIVVAFLGARVMPSIVNSVSNVVSTHYANKDSVTPDPDEEEEGA